MTRAILLFPFLVVLVAGQAGSYPLDGYPDTGIARLEAYSRAKEVLLGRGTLKPGSLWPSQQVQLGLVGTPALEWETPDPELTKAVSKLLSGDTRGYGIAVLDITDPENPRYAAHNPGRSQNPGSVGKLMVALGWFQALADVHPGVEERVRLLKETVITADAFIGRDHHLVPIWQEGDPKVRKQPIAVGDQATLWTFMDWMLSASSNAAAALLTEHLMLLVHFGAEYPVSEERAAAFFAETPKAELGALLKRCLQEPLTRNGLSPGKLRQGSFFSRSGKQRVPGTNSIATAQELLRYLVLMESGRLVDPWSSLQIKRLMYMTDRRIRYASAPQLNEAAVYFKSGSLYSCVSEEGFVCEKYHGNKWNFMNSVAIVETAEDGRDLHYLVVVLSNVLRKNSAVEHQTLGGRIHRLLEKQHPAVVPEPALPAADPNAAGAASASVAEPEPSVAQPEMDGRGALGP